MASEPEGAPQQPVSSDGLKPSAEPSAAPSTPKEVPAQAGASASPAPGSLPAGTEAAASSLPPGTVAQSEATPASPVPQNPEGYPSEELARSAPVGDPHTIDPHAHGEDPYHQEYHHDDPHHHDSYHGDAHLGDSGHQHDEYGHHHGGDDHYSGGYTPPPPEEEHGFVKAVRSVTNVLRTDDDAGGEGGGPVKPFLDHLEDFRWMLIKVVAALLVAMMACLVGANALVKFLVWPLKEARVQSQLEALKADKPQVAVPVMFDTNRIGTLQLQLLGIDPVVNHTNLQGHIRSVQVVPVDLGSNKFLGLQITTNSPRATDPLVELVILGPLDVIWITLQLALFGGLVIAAPFVFYFIGQFVLPALRVNEKEFLKPFAFWGTLLFLSGVAFCYLVILPLMLRMTVEFSQWLGFSAEQWRAQEYLSMVPKFLLAMGLSFEMPVVILTIVKIGLLDSKKLSWFRAYFVVINLFVCAVVSPSGDPFTMFLMAAPLCVLYEACILIARFWEWRDRKREASSSKPAGE